MDLYVDEKREVAEDTVRVRLARPDGQKLPSFVPGAHIELAVGGFTRSYSLTGPVQEPGFYEIHVLRRKPSRGGSAYIYDRLASGDIVEVTGPFNGFAFNDDSTHCVFIAGGIGITPFLPMMTQCHAQRRSFELHYAARRAARLVPLPKLNGDIYHYTSDCGSRINVGSVLGQQPKATEVYICGPRQLIEDVRRVSGDIGIDGNRVHFESFGPTLTAKDHPLTVHLAISNISIDVPPGKPILDALLEAGVWAPYECRRGECGSCATEIVSGTADHRDLCLTPSQRENHICTCISWAETDNLTLNI